MITTLTVAVGMYAVVFFLAEPIVGIFNREQNTVLLEIASRGLRLYFIAFIFVGFNIITAVRFNSVSNPIKSFSISMLRSVVLIIPIAFILTKLLGMTGVWLAFPTTELLTTIVCLILLLKRRSEFMKLKVLNGDITVCHA